MSKRFVCVCLMLIAVCFVSVAHATPSLGFSHYNPKKTVYTNKATTFAVGRVTNTGNETLNIKAFYVQTSYVGMDNNTVLAVTVNPETKILAPQQNYKVFATVHPKTEGKYEGTIEIEPHITNEANGNPIVTGGSFNFEVTTTNFVEPPPQTEDEKNKKNVYFPFLFIASIIVCASLVSGLYLLRRNKKPKSNKHPKKHTKVRLTLFFLAITFLFCIPLVFADETSDGTASVSTPNPRYYFNFAFQDLDTNNVESIISWQLWNGSGDLSYTEGQATLNAGNYTLKTLYLNHQINESTVDTAIYGNSSFTTNLQMKKQLTQSRWIAFNNTIGSITVNSASDSSLNFTVTGSGTFLTVVATPRNCSHITKDGVNQTGWTYSSTPSNHVYLTSTLSTWVFYHASEAGEATPWSGLSTTTLLQHLFEGNIFGFIQAIYIGAFQSLDLFYAMIILMLTLPLYIRVKSLLFLCILWILVGGFFLVAFPIASGVGVFLVIFAIGGMFFKVFMSIRG